MLILYRAGMGPGPAARWEQDADPSEIQAQHGSSLCPVLLEDSGGCVVGRSKAVLLPSTLPISL